MKLPRQLKPAKNPQPARLKNELRSVNKMVKKATDGEELFGLNASRAVLIEQFVALLPEDKRIRTLNLQNKQILVQTERKIVSCIFKVMKWMKNAEKTYASKLKKPFKKLLAEFRSSWKECRIEEVLDDFNLEMERLKVERIRWRTRKVIRIVRR
jgi:hypothetical protein